MGKRTYLTDVAVLALLYRHKCDHGMMISYEKIEKFDEVINQNLDDKNSLFRISIRCADENQSNFYFTGKDENGVLYAIIYPNADFDKAWDRHVGCLPADIIVAALQQNALATIGLQLVNGKLQNIQNDLDKLEEANYKVKKKLK